MSPAGTRQGASKTEQQHTPARSGPAARAAAPAPRFQQLQRFGGNQAMQRLLRAYGARPQAPEPEETADEDGPQEQEVEPGEQEAAAGADGTGADGEAGGASGVRDDFTPAEYTDLPDEDVHVEVVGPEGEGFVDQGRTGTAAFGGGSPESGDERPRYFYNGGRTGFVAWAGGGGAGAHGNQPAGSIQTQVAPVYDSSPPPAAGGSAEAWIRAGTGQIRVIRSWIGIRAGNQGTGWYVTPKAADRINYHERLHVRSARSLYITHLRPLLQRVQMHSPRHPRTRAATVAAAVAALQAIIRWPASVTAFQTADRAANGSVPLGTVDTRDLASGTYPINAGAGMVGGVAYANRLRLPREPNPT